MDRETRRRNLLLGGSALTVLGTVGLGPTQLAQAQQQPATPPAGGTRRPNILVIFGDDVGQSNISAYTFGLMGYKTPQHRPHRQRRRDVHRLLCREELHGGPLDLHHGPVHCLRTGLSKVGVPGADGRACRRATSPSPRR